MRRCHAARGQETAHELWPRCEFTVARDSPLGLHPLFFYCRESRFLAGPWRSSQDWDLILFILGRNASGQTDDYLLSLGPYGTHAH